MAEDVFEKRRKEKGLSSSSTDIFEKRRQQKGLVPTPPKRMADSIEKYGSIANPVKAINSTIKQAEDNKLATAKSMSSPTKLIQNAITNPTRQKSQYAINKESIEELSPYNPVKYYAGLMNVITQGNPVGQFVSRVGSTPDAIMSGGNPATVRPDLGKTANTVADVLGSVLTVATPSGAPAGVGPLAAPYTAVDKVVAASPRVQRAESAISRTLTSGGLKPQMAQAVTRELVREGAAGAVQGPALAMMQGQPSNEELLESAVVGSLTGAALSGVGAAAGSAIKTAANNRKVGQALMNAIENTELPVNPYPSRNVELPQVNRSVEVSPGTTAVASEARLATRPTDPQPRERGFNQTIKGSDLATPELKQSLQSTYTPITNFDTVAGANQRISTLGVDATEAKLLNKTKFTAEDVATGMRLIQELQTSGNIERAVSIADKVSSELTKAGQTVQAASIWNRLSPEGALLAAQRKVQRVNENLLRGQSPVKITEQQASTIMDTAQTIQGAGISQERAGTVSEIMSRVRRGEEITALEKQEVLDFVQDAKKFLQPTKTRTPKPAGVPKEMKDVRVRDRVVSFLDDQERAALERIQSRRGRMNSLPLDEWMDYAIVGAAKLSKGAIRFAEWSTQMIGELGENIRPYLNEIYEKAKEYQSQSVKKINDQVISRAERITDNYIKRNEANLSESDITFVQNLARKVSDLSGQEQRIASQDLQAVIQGFERVGIGRKIQAAQYISMLLNPLTQIRNVVGNEMLYRFERIQRVLATPIDIAASKVTGGPRTVTFKRGPNVWENFFQPTQDFASNLGEGMRAGWRGVSPEGLTSKYDIQGQAFRSKYNPLTYMEKSLGAVLQGFDYAAYQRAVNQRLSEMSYLDALNKGIRGDEAIRQHMQMVMTNVDDTIHTIAKDYGKFVTLQNDSSLAKAITGFRRGANKITTGSPDFGLGSVAVPFAKTPANLLLRGLDYSPAGVLKAFKQMHDLLRVPTTDLTRGDVIESVTRSLFGTGIGVMAYWLADKGVLWGKSDKDSEVRKLMQSSGVKDFQINGSAVMRMLNAALSGEDVDQAAKMQPGDTLWAYEWAQPASMPLAIGSNVYQGVKEDKGLTKTSADAAFSAVNTLLDSSVLSSIREVFQIPQNSENPFKSVAMNLAKQVPSQFVPSIVRQINSLSDNSVRETYAMRDDVLGQITNYAESTVPGLAQELPQRVSTLGEPQTKLNTFLDVFVSPAQRSQYKPTADAQLVIDLINETGDNSIAPRAVAKYISGTDKETGLQKRVDLTPEQYVELQRIVGEATAEGLKKINPEWSTEKKVTKILKILDEAGKKGRNHFKKEFGLKVSK